MAVVVRWKADGDYLCGFGFCERDRPTMLWSKRQLDARRFRSRRHALEEMHAHVGVAEETLASGSRFIRLVPKRRNEEPAPALRADSPATVSRTHEGVTIAAPGNWTLEDLARVVRSWPGLNVALDAEVKRAAEEAREEAAALREVAKSLALKWDANADSAGDAGEASIIPESRARYFSRADTRRWCADELRKTFGIDSRETT